MENKYLEKVAGWAQRYAETKAGQNNPALKNRTHVTMGPAGADGKRPMNASRASGASSNAELLASLPRGQSNGKGLAALSAPGAGTNGGVKAKLQRLVGKQPKPGKPLGLTSTAHTVSAGGTANKFRETTDSLGANSAADRLSATRAAKSGAGAAEKGVLAQGKSLAHKALGMAKKNPLAAGAIGLGAAAAGGMAMRKKDDNQGYYQQ